MDKWMDGWMSGCMDKWMKNQKRRLHNRLKAIFPVFPDIYAEIPGVYKTYLPKTFFILCTQSNLPSLLTESELLMVK